MPSGIYPRTEVMKKNMSLAHKGQITPFTPGHSIRNTGRTHFKKGETPKFHFQKGNIPWNKGKPMPSTTGSKNPYWKGGRIVRKDGYIFILSKEHPFCSKQGYVMEHRLVMEKQLGRYLTPQEVVHHRNRIKHDNRIENLKLYSSISEHHKLTHTQIECPNCHHIFPR